MVASHRLELVDIAAEILTHCHADNTKITYKTGQRHYFEFARSSGLISPFPVREQDMMLFVAYLRLLPIKYKTIYGYLQHVYSAHVSLGYGTEYKEFYALKFLMKGLKRVLGDAAATPRLPMTAGILKEICAELAPGEPDQAMIQAAMTVAFYMLLRSGEVAVNTVSYVGLKLLIWENAALSKDSDGREKMALTTRESKTDPFRIGRVAYTGRGADGACPIEAVTAHFKHQKALGRAKPSDPLFQFRDGEILTYGKFLKLIKALARVADIPDSRAYSGHSFRKGGATALLRAGVPVAVIMEKGNWKSYDSMNRYLVMTGSEVAGYSSLMK